MSRMSYFWVVARDAETGKRYLVVGGDTEDEARRQGLELLGGVDFEIKEFNTRDINRASSFLRGQRLAQTHSLKEASRRIGHEKSLQRFKQRRGLGL